MKRIALLLVLLGGCREAAQEAPAPSPENKFEIVKEEGVAAAPAPAPEIPVEFRGLYERDAAACAGDPTELRLRVEADAMRFHESIGRVRRVIPEGKGAISVDAAFEGEGERWSNVLRLRLGEGGSLAIALPDGSETVRARCSGPVD